MVFLLSLRLTSRALRSRSRSRSLPVSLASGTRSLSLSAMKGLSTGVACGAGAVVNDVVQGQAEGAEVASEGSARRAHGD